MSQSSGNNPTSPQPELKPALQSILGSLDVKLEDELTRYRRYRRQSKPGERPPAAPAQTARTNPQAIAISPGTEPPQPDPQTRPTAWESVVLPEPAPIVPHSPEIAAQNGNGSHDATSGATAPDGYLESTEQLIDSIEKRREYRRRRRENSLAKKLLTPVGLVSMLLLFLSCAALGYVVTSPSGMKVLGLDRVFGNGKSSEPEPVEAADVEPTSPNLATQEFVDLDLNTLSNIDPNPGPPPAPPSPSATLPEPGAAASPSAPTPIPTGPGLNNLSEELLPEPVAPTPTPAPAPAPAPAAPAPKPAGGSAARPSGNPVQAADGYYYVVTDYQDERGLEAAREVVPDAYVREFKTGVKIQFGALGDAAAAKRLAEELRVQGIAVQYDTPKE